MTASISESGALHRLVARTDLERRTVFAAIGPFWDGNEVWLVAAGGVLFMAFPRLYSAAFSGFYMPLMIVLWLLIFRGVSIEFRSHAEDPLVREFWDTVFAFSSSLLAVVLGASLGNVVRGVPVEATGEFAMPLFTDFLPGKRPGVFDWYTTLAGLFSLLVLAGHGALFLVWKTTGPVHLRAQCSGPQGLDRGPGMLAAVDPGYRPDPAGALHDARRAAVDLVPRTPDSGRARGRVSLSARMAGNARRSCRRAPSSSASWRRRWPAATRSGSAPRWTGRTT